MAGSVLYLGDTSLQGAAGYLAGLLSLWGWSFDYLPSDQALTAADIQAPRQLLILSDYSAKYIHASLQQRLVAQVEQGAGLLMIGGWESFCGETGHWADTPVGQILPVHIAAHDDRTNCPQPALVVQRQNHAILDNLPWNDCPPTIGGLNAFTPKSAAQVLLEVERYHARRQDGQMAFTLQDRFPLLVIGQHSRGRTAALATDVAPHWVGGLVDWGTGRVKAQAPGSWQIEVGNLYAAFLRQLLGWTGQMAVEAGSWKSEVER